MILKCKHCGHCMFFTGMPTYITWFCEKCFEVSDNYDVDLREEPIHLIH